MASCFRPAASELFGCVAGNAAGNRVTLVAFVGLLNTGEEA